MHKLTLLLSVLCVAKFAAADYGIGIWDNAGGWSTLWAPDGARYCYCLTKTQTARLYAKGEYNVKLFSTSNCSGNYADGSNKITENAQWVNSISFGAAGIPSV
ncbi:hypothetical protein FBU30_006001, partial [Linnemannia zychae]